MTYEKLLPILILPLLLVLIYSPVETDALSSNKEYVFLSEKYFFVFALDENKHVTPMDGGVFYKDQWQIFNMTDTKVRQLDEQGRIGWIEEGKLNDSTDEFWFTWNLVLEDTGKITSVYVYDGENMVEETDHNTYMTRLFIY